LRRGGAELAAFSATDGERCEAPFMTGMAPRAPALAAPLDKP
jgi:hypothetical protein